MRTQRYVLSLSIALVLIVIAAMAVGYTTALSSGEMQCRQLAAVIGAAGDSEAEDLMYALKQEPESSIASGAEVMDRFGYSPKLLADRGFFRIMPLCLAVGLALFAMFALFFILDARHRKRRIDNLTKELSDINKGQEKILIGLGEDWLSPLEDELGKTVVALRESRETAVAGHKALADALADISHQLKTPLASMTIMTDLITADSSEKSRDYARRLKTQIEKLSHLVSSLLALSRLDAGALELKKDTLDVETLLSSAAESIAPLVDKKAVDIKIHGSTRASFTGDSEWMIEALINLIKNCYEHVGEGGEISLCWHEDLVAIRIYVEDNGPGFSREDLPYLFERFYKGNNSGAGSVGIGLALSKSIIEAQGGGITAENRKEGGAKFQINMYKS